MKSISLKLFLSLLGLTAIILVATLGLAQWSFQVGFMDYRSALEIDRLQTMASELSEHY